MKILVVDDETELRERLEQTLRRERYQVETAADGNEALRKISADHFDLVLLDIMLPGVDGLSVLKEMRAVGIETPVLMLSAHGDVGTRVRGLDLGADDYLAKPFSMAELMARVRAMLRRSGGRDPVLIAGPISLDTAKREVRLDGELLQLTVKEFSILEFLLYNRGRVVSRFNLAEHVWGDEFDPFTMSNFIDVHMKNLRQKIRGAGEESIIRTIRGVGFIIDGER